MGNIECGHDFTVWAFAHKSVINLHYYYFDIITFNGDIILPTDYFYLNIITSKKIKNI